MKTVAGAANELEGFVVKQLLQTSGAFRGTGEAGSTFVNGLFADTLAEVVSKSGGLGVGAVIARQIEQQAPQERHAPSTPHISSNFGPRLNPITGHQQFHRGVDLPAPEGTPVPSLKAGTVTSAGERGGYGLAVEVAHADGTTSLYAHLSEVAVHPGDHLEANQPLGRVGQTGQSTGPHLHLEVREGGHAVNPTMALKAYRLRADNLGGETP